MLWFFVLFFLKAHMLKTWFTADDTRRWVSLKEADHWGVTLKGIFYPVPPLSPGCHQVCSFSSLHPSSTMFLPCHRPKSNMAREPWTETSELMDQNISFLI